jgi:hypothetical protein
VKIHITTTTPRPKPKAGDRRTTKTHGVQIRVQCMSCAPNGQPQGRIVSNGRPVFDWRRPDQLDAWDHHHLTDEERAAHFPPKKAAP